MPLLPRFVRRLLLAITLVALTLACVIVGRAAGPADAAPTAPRPSGTVTMSGLQLVLGVQTFSMWRDWDEHAALMDQAVAAGSTWLRVDVGWCSLEEHGPGVVSEWYLSRLDTVVADARDRGLNLLITLTCAPTWATPSGTVQGYPSRSSQYRRVARYLAARYGDQVAAWEIWNEPNCVDGGCPHGTAAAYLPILRAGYRGVKAGWPAATVVSGGISGADVTWVQQLLRLGGGRYLDALAVHPYLAPAAAAPTEPAVPGYTNPYRLTNLPAVERLLRRYGDAGKPIWLTEFGWTTGRTPDSPYDGVTPAVQAAYLSTAVRFIRSHYPFVTAAFWYMLRDRDDSNDYEDGFGLLDRDGNPKPAFYAFRTASQ